MSDKKVRVKVKKKKLNFKKITIALLLLAIIFIGISYLVNIPIKNIYIVGNNILSDKEIISLAGIEDYPSIAKTIPKSIEKKLVTNDYIKTANVKLTLLGKITITIEEERPLFIYNNKLVLSSGKQVENNYSLNYVPIVKNDIDELYDEVITSFNKINSEALLKISEIEYKPNELDKERFLLTMTDANYVFINLLKSDKINKYNTISNELNGKKGIIYLDSGDYVEIKD